MIIDGGYLRKQLDVVRAVPRLVEMKLIVEAILFWAHEWQQMHAPT